MLIAESPEMQPVLELIERVGPSEANVLITGENGTGKGVVARALHAVSPRAAVPMVTVNTGGLSEALFESELFGHVRGAFTDAKTDRVGRFELADGGTLFLDEIANISLNQQAKLLRVLETGEFERRRLVQDPHGRRADRLGHQRRPARGGGRRPLPPGSAVPAEHGGDPHPAPARPPGGHPPARPLLPASNTPCATARPSAASRRRRSRRSSTHPWPGNVRELDHAVERGVLMGRGEHRDRDWVRAPDLGLQGPSSAPAPPRLEDLPLEDVEKMLIQKALARYGNVSQAAQALGLSRSALYRRLEKHGL